MCCHKALPHVFNCDAQELQHIDYIGHYYLSSAVTSFSTAVVYSFKNTHANTLDENSFYIQFNSYIYFT
jgi:hypothetical protein